MKLISLSLLVQTKLDNLTSSGPPQNISDSIWFCSLSILRFEFDFPSYSIIQQQVLRKIVLANWAITQILAFHINRRTRSSPDYAVYEINAFDKNCCLQNFACLWDSILPVLKLKCKFFKSTSFLVRMHLHRMLGHVIFCI